MLFSVRADGSGKIVELDIFDTIGGDGFFSEGVTAKSVRRTLAQYASADTIKLRINSKGGDVMEGFAIYNLLASHKARVVAEVDMALSMASVIMCAADEVSMADNAMLMIHNPRGVARGEASDLRAIADVWDKMCGSMANAYAGRTGMAKDKILKLMAAETWMTAKEAQAKGFVDSVIPTKRKATAARAYACITAEDLKAYANVPDAVWEAVLRTSDPNFAPVADSATLCDVDQLDEIHVDIEEEMTEKQTPEPVAAQTPDLAAVLTAALAPFKAALDALTAKVEAQAASAVASDASAVAATFGARVNAECERVITAQKLHNTPEARAFFVAMAKDEAGLSALSAHYNAAPPVVATAALIPAFVPAKDGGVALSASQLKLCDKFGWDPKALSEAPSLFPSA